MDPGLISRDTEARGGVALVEAMIMAHVEFPGVLVLACQILQSFLLVQPRGRHPGMRKHMVGLTPSLAQSGGFSFIGLQIFAWWSLASSPFMGFFLQALLPTAPLPTNSPSCKPHSHSPHRATPGPRPRVTPASSVLDSL